MHVFRPIVLLIKLLRESVSIALQSIMSNKLRTFLSLFGITIGIFAIISIFTLVDSLEKNVRDSLNTLGNNTIYINKWPWSEEGEFPWWKYQNRPQPNVQDLSEIRRRSNLTQAACMCIYADRSAKFLNNSAKSELIGVSSDYEQLASFDLADGRYFSAFELEAGRRLAVIGATLARDLCQGVDPIGKPIKIDGRTFTIVGVFKKEGSSAFTQSSHDNAIVMPLGALSQMVNPRWSNPDIRVKGRENVPVEELSDELLGILRAFHRLKPGDEEDFSLNRVSMMENQLNAIFSTITLAGGIIAFFSILVGGFGIANIMFVSVKERTSQIGIQKALGAKRYFILSEFLFESVLLSLLGGAIGLILIFLATLLIGDSMSFKISLSGTNISTGLLISITIGIISGIVPALHASKLNPVEAINSTAG